MRYPLKTAIVGAASALILSVGVQAASAQTDDQRRLDAAVDEFEQRMTEAGWVGEPADEDDDDVDEDVEDDADEDDGAIADDEFTECLGEMAAVFEGNADDDEFPGQTALRESMEFTFQPAGVGSTPETTEGFSFDIEAEETIAAFAVSVDDSGVDVLDTFVDTIGSKETGDCMREAMEADMAADTGPDDVPMELEVEVANEADIGVGDRSARLQFAMSTSFMGIPFVFDFSMYMARVDHDLVMVVHGTFGEPETLSGIDPIAELQTIVDSLAG